MLIHGEEVVAAKLHWPGDLPVDSTALAQLVSKPAGGARGLARMANGTEILIDRIPPRATEGSALTLRITRAAIAERGRFKRAQGRVIESEAERLAWVAADPNIENSQCFECSNQYPMYLSLQGGIQNCPAGATTVLIGSPKASAKAWSRSSCAGTAITAPEP